MRTFPNTRLHSHPQKPDQPPSPEPDDVRTFYDRFFADPQRDYSHRPNARIEKAIARILPLVKPESTVLEIGCGTGLLVEQIGRSASRGSVWACDISEHAIALAADSIKTANAHFRTLDATTQFQDLKSWLPGPVDLVVMVDVIEHIPLGKHTSFFQDLAGVIHAGSIIVMTFPSPIYQNYLREYNPAELQIIDETIELPHLHTVINENGFIIKEYSLEDVWLPNQYVHCILKRNKPLTPSADQIAIAIQEIADLIPTDEKFILVDQNEWRARLPSGLQAFPFTERDGLYWGPPTDDDTALRELDRLRAAGATHIIFGSSTFWWLDHYAAFHSNLQTRHRCILKNDRLIVFKLLS